MYERYIKESDARLAIMDYIGSVAECKVARDGAEGAMYAIETAPTADVVPRAEAENQSVLWRDHFNSIYETAKETFRAEVAREIFEEIESNIYPMLGLENDKEYVAILSTTFAELKKKYT